MSYAVELIAIPAQTIAYLAAHGSVRNMKPAFERLLAAVAEAGLAPLGPPMARFDLDMEDPENADYEVAVPIAIGPHGKVPDKTGEVHTGTLPAHEALVITHKGPYDEIIRGYTALTEELNALGYAVVGPASEVYLVGPDSGADPADYITEVRLPVSL